MASHQVKVPFLDLTTPHECDLTQEQDSTHIVGDLNLKREMRGRPFLKMIWDWDDWLASIMAKAREEGVSEYFDIDHDIDYPEYREYPDRRHRKYLVDGHFPFDDFGCPEGVQFLRDFHEVHVSVEIVRATRIKINTVIKAIQYSIHPTLWEWACTPARGTYLRPPTSGCALLNQPRTMVKHPEYELALLIPPKIVLKVLVKFVVVFAMLFLVHVSFPMVLPVAVLLAVFEYRPPQFYEAKRAWVLARLAWLVRVLNE